MDGSSTEFSVPQALMLTGFKEWPRDAITVEFWMLSVDKCRKGVPFSYATGGYERADNTFLILNYNDWCTACFVMYQQFHCSKVFGRY